MNHVAHRMLLPALAGLLLNTAAARAEGPHGGPGPGHPPPPPLADVVLHHAEDLGLDDSTLDRIAALADASRAESQSLRETADAERQALRRLMDSSAAQETAVLAQARRVGDADTAMLLQRIKTDLAVRKLLTPEQLETLKALRPGPPPGGMQPRGEGMQREGGDGMPPPRGEGMRRPPRDDGGGGAGR